MAADGSNSPRFRYGLQALLRKRCAELDLVREELAVANERLETHTRALEAQAAQVAQLEIYQRDLSRGGASIDVEERKRLHDCLRSAVLQKAQQAVQVEQARQQQESVLAQVRAARQALKAIERHREQSQEQFNVEQLRKALLVTDELHLSSLRANAAAGRATRMTNIVSSETPQVS
jgi:hypothetical protein